MKSVKKFIGRFPIITFLIILGLIFVVIFIGKKMRSEGEVNDVEKTQIKKVRVFSQNAKVETIVKGKVNRADTIILRATAGGIVKRALGDGAKVYRGQEIIKLVDTYEGTSQASVGVAIAQRNAQYQDEIFEKQKKIFHDQKKEIGSSDSRSAKIARRQISLQKRAAELVFDTSKLQVQQAYAGLALQKTVAPLAGQVEEVFVRIGDSVQPGQILSILKANTKKEIRVVAHVGTERAAHIDLGAAIIAEYKQKNIPLEIVHIAQSGANSQAYALTFKVSDNFDDEIIEEGSFLEIKIPLRADNDFIIPLDVVHFGTGQEEVYVVKDGRAKAKNVVLGNVIGSYVVVSQGLQADEQIIMNRNITDGESVIVQ